MPLDDVELVADDQRHHDLHARNRSGQRYRRWTSSKVWIREASPPYAVEEPREVVGERRFVCHLSVHQRRGASTSSSRSCRIRAAPIATAAVPRRPRRRRSSGAARFGRTRSVAALGQYRWNGTPLKKYSCQSPPESEPRRVDGECREPEPGVRGHEEARRLDQGELLQDPAVERVDRVLSAREPIDLTASVPLVVLDPAERPTSTTTISGRCPSSASRMASQEAVDGYRYRAPLPAGMTATARRPSSSARARSRSRSGNASRSC